MFQRNEHKLIWIQINLGYIQGWHGKNHTYYNLTTAKRFSVDKHKHLWIAWAQHGQLRPLQTQTAPYLKYSTATVRGILSLMLSTKSCIFCFLLVLAGKCTNQVPNMVTKVNQTHRGKKKTPSSLSQKKKAKTTLEISGHKLLKGFGVKVWGVLSGKDWKMSLLENLPCPLPKRGLVMLCTLSVLHWWVSIWGEKNR